MNNEEAARELVKIAKDLTVVSSSKFASKDILDGILPQKLVANMRKTADEITYKLAVEVYKELRTRMTLSNQENEALNRLQYAANSRDEGMIRNNVFKAANVLGMKLPHSSF